MTDSPPLAWILAALALAYLLGSVPFGLILTRLAGLGDIRNIGSGNIGATNVLRTGRRGLAAATLILDGAKGALAVAIARYAGSDMITALAALAAIAGHLFPVWLGFRGGKGVATTLGLWLVYAWPVGLAACAIWLTVARLWRYSSLAALIAVAATIPLAAFWGGWWPGMAAVAIAALVSFRHHGNIRRLLAGTEPKIGAGA